MRTMTFFALVGIFFGTLYPAPTAADSLHQFTGETPNYVVIGAFAYQRNALRFTRHASRDLHLNAKFEMNVNRNLYYVYVLSTLDRDEAIAEALRLREESEFRDTWVFNGLLGKHQSYQGMPAADIHPLTGKAIQRVTTTEPTAMDVYSSQGSSTAQQVDDTIENTTAYASASRQEITAPVTLDEEVGGKAFYFKIFRGNDLVPVEGDVDVIDQDKLKKLGSYKGNTTVRLSMPSNKSGNLSLVCEVFGYRKVQRDIDYNEPLNEDIEPTERGVTVPFELVRLQKGDIAIMYNVYFFKDAGIMRPESRFEVNSLLEMLKENEKYKIRIHGHTNGGASGKIVSMSDNSTNFFSLTNTKEGFGSAKKLSEERADVIKRYLLANGIDPKRMQIKAWGGRRPLHDKHHTRAQENVRVEIEILEDK